MPFPRFLLHTFACKAIRFLIGIYEQGFAISKRTSRRVLPSTWELDRALRSRIGGMLLLLVQEV